MMGIIWCDKKLSDMMKIICGAEPFKVLKNQITFYASFTFLEIHFKHNITVDVKVRYIHKFLKLILVISKQFNVTIKFSDCGKAVTIVHLCLDIDGLVHDCSNSIASAQELLQSYSKPSVWFLIGQGLSILFTWYCYNEVIVRVYFNFSSHWSCLLIVMQYFWKNNLQYMDHLMQDCSISIANALEILQPCTKQSIDSLVQDCSISIANALEILQSCTKP